LNKYKIDLSFPTFKRTVKRLKKKFPSVNKDLDSIFSQLENEPPIGVPIPLINAPVYKVRIKNSDIQKGKSRGYRLVYKFDEKNKMITPLILYFKAEKTNVFNREIRDMLDSLEKSLFDEV